MGLRCLRFRTTARDKGNAERRGTILHFVMALLTLGVCPSFKPTAGTNMKTSTILAQRVAMVHII